MLDSGTPKYESCEMAAKGGFKEPLSNTCPVELCEQFEAFRRLTPAGSQEACVPGVSALGLDNASLNDISLLMSCLPALTVENVATVLASMVF